MSIVYFGTGTFAVPPLEAVKNEVSLVVTQPDRPTGRGLRVQPSPVKVKALELGLQVATPERAREPGFISAVEALKPKILLVASYGQILSQRLLDAAEHGGINLHGSILPKYRGAAPIQRAIMAGEKETGVTLMQMDKGMDTGDIIDIDTTTNDPDDTYGEVQYRLAAIAASQAKEWLGALLAGDYPRRPQEASLATIAPKVEKIESELHFDLPVREEYNRFRACTPAPGAFFVSRFGRVKVVAAHLSDEVGVPGTALPGGRVAFVGGSIELVEVQPEGRNKMSGRDLFNGMRLKAGERVV